MKISEEKIKKISEQIIFYLFNKNPQPIYTAHIAKEIARDEEFVKKILLDLKKNNLVKEIKTNKEGVDYIRRSRWKLTNKVYEFYSNRQR